MDGEKGKEGEGKPEEVKVAVETQLEKEDEGDNSPPIVALKVIYDNLQIAQSKTGAFNLADSRNIVASYNVLSVFFRELDAAHKSGTEKPLATAIHYDTLMILYKGLEIQNGNGIYSLSGAAAFLEKIEFLERILNSVKDPNFIREQQPSSPIQERIVQKTPGEKVKEKIEAKKKGRKGK